MAEEVRTERRRLERQSRWIDRIRTGGMVLLVAVGLGLAVLFATAMETAHYEELRRENEAKQLAGNAVLSDETAEVHEMLNALTAPQDYVQPAGAMREPSFADKVAVLMVQAIGGLRATFRLDLERAETTLLIILLLGWAILCAAWSKFTKHCQYQLAWKMMDLPDEGSIWDRED